MADLVKGVDVSRWNGSNIAWKDVKADGYLFAFIKATESTSYKQQFIDMGKAQAVAASKAGLKIGYYHFARPSNHGGPATDAIAEAKYFLTTVKTFPKPNFPLVLDLEDREIQMTPAEVEAWILAFQSELKKGGFSMLLYSQASYLDPRLQRPHKLGDVPLWLAQYPRTVDFNKGPTIPKGWKTWEVWQYSDKGTPKGFPAPCDVNVMQKAFFSKF